MNLAAVVLFDLSGGSHHPEVQRDVCYQHPQQIGVPFIIMQQVQPACIMAAMQSHMD